MPTHAQPSTQSPRRLIEAWLPIAEIGLESLRERTPMTPFPAPNRLHVWWARRPLVASRAAVLASILPEDTDRKMFMRVLGIHGDPLAARKAMDNARQTGIRVDDPYGYTRAFAYLPDVKERDWLSFEARRAGLNAPSCLDPTAGGGSIPFEAGRLGITTLANDLNPVAAFILHATLKWPSNCALAVVSEFTRFAGLWRQQMQTALDKYFKQILFPEQEDSTYLWARTITCPYCDGLIPLSPNWRLAPDGTGVRLHPQVAQGPDSAGRICTFSIVARASEQSEGTVAGGAATCPFPDCNRVVDGHQVKAIAQAGGPTSGMGEQLFAVVYKRRIETTTKSGKPGRVKWERGYRAPRPEDDVSAAIAARLAEKLPEWEALDIVPTEHFPTDSNDDRPIQYGMPLWRDLFSPRQLLCHGTSVEVYRALLAEEQAKPEFSEVTRAAFGYLALALDKMLDYNSRCVTWHSGREVMDHTFRQHAYPIKWSHAEMAPLIVGLGYDWAIRQVAKCITELIDLTRPDINAKAARKAGAATNMPQASLLCAPAYTPPPLTITCKPGDSLDHLTDASIDVVVMDPPYYNNVMYAELSDFFYVWLKRTAGYIYPELFTRALTDKENEAVANPAKFKGQKGAGALADADYKNRMAAIFAECRRVLKADGIMTLMFTHKATGAWDALTKGLMQAGFAITASWPINTEAEGSLHIKDKSAANSTIFLVCRPRPESDVQEETIFWEDLEPQVRKAVRARIAEFQQAGIRGVDLYLSSFGPALEIFSRHWPVRRGHPKDAPKLRRGTQASLLEPDFDPYEATPEDALDTARREVKNWRMEQLASTQRQAELDPLTEWFALAWDAFKAPQFPYDEALRLARVVGLDMDHQIIGTLAEKKGSDVLLWNSALRAAKGALGPTNGSRSMLDSLHHAAYIGRTKTLDAAREMLVKTGLDKEPVFLKALSVVLEVLPPSRAFTKVDISKALEPAASDFEVLERLRHLAFSDQVRRPVQLSLLESEA